MAQSHEAQHSTCSARTFCTGQKRGWMLSCGIARRKGGERSAGLKITESRVFVPLCLPTFFNEVCTSIALLPKRTATRTRSNVSIITRIFEQLYQTQGRSPFTSLASKSCCRKSGPLLNMVPYSHAAALLRHSAIFIRHLISHHWPSVHCR